MIAHTEERIAKCVMKHALQKQCISIPNTKAIWGRLESDVIILSPNNVLCEVEIKISRSDYKQDFRKVRKHQRLASGKCPVNKFLYACPEGLIHPDELPDYAGLTWIINGIPVVQKKAPVLNKTKIKELTKDRMFRSLCWKYTK